MEGDIDRSKAVGLGINETIEQWNAEVENATRHEKKKKEGSKRRKGKERGKQGKEENAGSWMIVITLPPPAAAWPSEKKEEWCGVVHCGRVVGWVGE